MKNIQWYLKSVLAASFLFSGSISLALDKPPLKEWTMLVFLNGHNNLDGYGYKDINEMEAVGSTNNINVVVQWASSSQATTKRVYVIQDTNTQSVTSPVVEDLPRVDMGDYKNLIEFIRWGVSRYPAKHYFIDVWNHGSGWKRSQQTSIRGISYDDFSHNHISTTQLGLAMAEAARIVGHKVDIYGSDACLMAMVEVATEMAKSVEILVGAEEVEPGDGWPYDRFLSRWVSSPFSSPAEIGGILAQEYVQSYQGKQEVTLSALDLNYTDELNRLLSQLSAQISATKLEDLRVLAQKLYPVQSFYYSDYVDLSDMISIAEQTSISTISNELLGKLKNLLTRYVVANEVTPNYSNAKGVSIWLPRSNTLYSTLKTKYESLRFQTEAHWLLAIEAVLRGLS